MLRSIILVLLTTLAALAQEQRTPRVAPRFRIAGTVVNATSGDPLSGIEISIGPVQASDSTQGVVTDQAGHFEFENLLRGKYWLAAQGRGLKRQLFEQHEEFSTGIAVGPDLDSEHLIFRLSPDASISGAVTDEQSEPVRDANIQLFRMSLKNGKTSTEIAGQTMTDDRGIYLLSHQEPGTYFIAVIAKPWYAESFRGVAFVSGRNSIAITDSAQAAQSELDVTYPVTFYPGTADPNGATPIILKSGDRASADITLSPVPALHLRITGVDPAQGNAANLTQRVIGDYPLPLPTQVNFSQKGEAYIEGIPPGQFDLSLQSWGNTPSFREKRISISENGQTDVADATVEPHVSGVLSVENGKPLPNQAYLQFRNTASGQAFGAQVSAKGEFEVTGGSVRPGTYEILVGGIADALVRSLSAEGAKVTGHELEIADGASVRLNITLSLGSGRIDGTAIHEGKPMSGAMIVLVPQDLEHNSTLVRRDQSDSDGTFSLYSVLPGKYTVIALANGWDLQWMNPGVLQPYLAGGESIEVNGHGKYNLKINVQ